MWLLTRHSSTLQNYFMSLDISNENFFLFYLSFIISEPLLLRRYLQSCRNDVEKAKKLLEFSFNLRNNHPQIFLQRDPCDKATQKVHQCV